MKFHFYLLCILKLFLMNSLGAQPGTKVKELKRDRYTPLDCARGPGFGV